MWLHPITEDLNFPACESMYCTRPEMFGFAVCDRFLMDGSPHPPTLSRQHWSCPASKTQTPVGVLPSSTIKRGLIFYHISYFLVCVLQAAISVIR